MRRTFDCALVAVALLMFVFAISPGGASVYGWTLLDVGGDQVRIYRDEFGVAHMFAETSRGYSDGETNGTRTTIRKVTATGHST